MNINRREFIKVAGGLAIAGVARPLIASAKNQQHDKRSFSPPRVAVLFEPSFPAGEISLLNQESISQALQSWDVKFLNVNELKKALTIHDFDVYVNPYGSLFPLEAEQTILQFLVDGGNWVNCGGVPFSIPVVKAGDTWRAEVGQTQYHKKLGITQAFPVATSEVAHYEPNSLIDQTQKLVDEFTAEEIYELYVCFTTTKDFPDEDGSGGQRDAVLRTLLFGQGKNKQWLASPIVQIDRLQGDFAGGRWMLANFKGTLGPKMLNALVSSAAEGAMELVARPSFACYREGELPSFTIQCRRPKGDTEKIVQHECRFDITDAHGRSVEHINTRLVGAGTLLTGQIDMSYGRRASLSPGLYHVKASLELNSLSSNASVPFYYSTGFWIYDASLLAKGAPLSVDANYFLRDGKTFPITGTTYMTSDVHRKFLFEPNPYLWDQDFAEMQSAGINTVRTGIWTGWKNFMLDVGAQNETALRAMDAFVLTARKYDIPLIFTLFAFLPEAWGGVNAYLDPRSVNAQKEFVSAFAHRYRMVNDLIWDFINEPSFCNPQHLWECRPNYDVHEKKAWVDWLKNRYNYQTDDELIAHLQELYRTTADNALELPAIEEFADANIFNASKPIKVIDYHLFAQEMFSRWTKEMAAAVRSNGNPHQLVTVGQDEGGTGERPSPQFFADAVDFTCIHNWWLNDDLVWDNVVSKVPGRPNLVEETGVMFYEKMDGSAWRTEDDVRNLLERKLAIAFGAGGAGFIEWMWNTNPYMMSDNEAAIGLHRVDGTRKPEIEPVITFARFFAEHKNLMVGREEEEVVMVIPHSQQYSTRNFATDATKRCVRTLAYHFNTQVASISEYAIDTLRRTPKLIIVPSLRTLNQHCWDALLSFAEKGSTILITGVIDTDDHWLPVERAHQLGLTAESRPITEEEFLVIDGTEHRLSYRGEKIQRIEKAVVQEDASPSIHIIPRGKGKLIWSPLPVEVSDAIEPTIALYQFVLKQANVAPIISLEKNNDSILVLPTLFEHAMLYACVSECDRDTTLKVTHHASNTTIEVNVPSQRAAMVLIEKKDGRIIARI
jgi:hypothetical protein